ncbi:hypothetical protein B296_00023001 [Ensete ventricosum]|uniref:Uncharacterized protein n=1 Tax=Ensete ventricosum TaxID=4639 RepID=A0A427A327_ENSVE|nr:hypothetical protein B296_00023001 [Ensete ventricosum]
MKASGSQHKGLAKKGLGCNKSKSLKITKQKREITGTLSYINCFPHTSVLLVRYQTMFTFNVIFLFPGKKSSELGGQLHTSPIQLPRLEIQDMQTSFPEAEPGDLKFVQGLFQDFNGKVKLQLFPIDEATRKALEKLGPRVEQASLNNICPIPVTVDACLEPKSRSEESLNGGNQFAGMNLSLPDSLGPLESIAPCSREMNDGETVGLGGLITSSMDAFQNFSIF